MHRGVAYNGHKSDKKREGALDMARKKNRNTKGKIVSAAWDLFYRQGYENTTVEEIIEESGTSRGSFITISTERMPCCPP